MRKGLGYHNRRSPFGFNPGTLFATGAQGVWYDPSDASTLFSDTAGTTPSPTPGAGALSVVGLMLDKSQGLALGSELFSTFTSTGTWTVLGGGAYSISSAAAQTDLSVSYSGTSGKRYIITFTASGVGGTVVCYPLNTNPFSVVNGTNTVRYSSDFGNFIIRATVGASATITNISVRELPGNHAISYNTTTARPELSARVNLEVQSENFSNSFTLLQGVTYSGDVAVAPNGTTTADLLTEDTSTGNHRSGRNTANISFVSGTSYTTSVYVKRSSGTRNVILRIDIGTSNFGANGTNFDLTNLVVTPSAGQTGTITSVGNGWYRLTMTAAPSISYTATYSTSVILSNGTNPTDNSYTGDGTSGILVWGADLRPANIGTSVPSYQRIADQYTYDSNGFPRYFIANGTATGMYTPNNLNLSGTDKVTVFAGLRKLSDAAAGVLVELSNNYNTNANTFIVTIPNGATTQVSSGISNGSGTYNQAYYTDSAAPLSTVNSTSYNKALNTDQVVFIRKNGADQTLTRSPNNNTGNTNFGSYPLYIGSRGNASFWFNGYIYSLIVVGAASTAAQITSTESWINVKEGGVY